MKMIFLDAVKMQSVQIILFQHVCYKVSFQSSGL
jgi:hypothetical protein